MNNKKMVCVVFILLKICNVYAQISENRFIPLVFSYDVSAAATDILTGNNPEFPGSHRNFMDKENISSCKVIRTTYEDGSYAPGSKIIEEFKYKNGLRIEQTYSFSGSNDVTTILYDEYGRKIQSGEDFSYEYPKGNPETVNERIYFYEGDIRSYQKVEITEEGFTYFDDEPNSFAGLNTIVYKYKNGFLQEICNSYEESLGTQITKFYYEDNLLTKITKRFEDENKLRVVLLIKKYDDNNNILEFERTINERTGPYIENCYFSDYDSHGNWQKSEIYKGEKLIDVYEREIIYIE